jgi:hypothetical protein
MNQNGEKKKIFDFDEEIHKNYEVSFYVIQNNSKRENEFLIGWRNFG